MAVTTAGKDFIRVKFRAGTVRASKFAHRPGFSLNLNSEVAVATPTGSTGHWPVPSGDPPLGMGKAHELFRASVSSASLLPVPSGQPCVIWPATLTSLGWRIITQGQWPDSTAPKAFGAVPPIPTSEFGIYRQFS